MRSEDGEVKEHLRTLCTPARIRLANGGSVRGISEEMSVMSRCLVMMIVLGSYTVGCTSEQPPLSVQSPAVNLLSPAPTPSLETALYSNECNVGVVRANSVGREGLLDVLGSYAPGWLPDGFGLLIGFQGSGRGMENGLGAIWANADCRQVHLEFLPDAANLESPRPEGQWELVGEGTCTFAPLIGVRCFSYHAQDNGGILNLMTVGLGPSDAARIVAGIPLAA
jgi:hypothetical protein